MRLLLALALLLPGLAHAQQPIQLGTQPIQLDLGPTGPVRYATQEIASVRFLGEDVKGPVFQAGERLELITEKDGWVRVRQGDRYGWVPADALSAEPPADDAQAAGAEPE